MSVDFYHVDAFAKSPFSGNPAAVIIFSQQTHFDDDKLLQSLATEFSLPATAFLLAATSKTEDQVPKFQIKWFSPTNRIPICGHGTLAASHILFELNKNATVVHYDAGPAGSLSAKLTDRGEVELEFPAGHVVDMDKAGSAVKQGVNLEEVLKATFPEPIELKSFGRGDRGGFVDIMVVELEEGFPLRDVEFKTAVLVSEIDLLIRGYIY